jgi:hypothetical protein
VFVHAERALYPVRVLCSVLGVSRSGYYAWIDRPDAARRKADEQLVVEIAAAHKRSRATYGSPRVHSELRSRGFRVGRKRIERLMRERGIQARRKRRFRRTTDSKHANPIAPNVLARKFAVKSPNVVWVADVTSIWTNEGWTFLAVILDLFARRVVGWAASQTNDAVLALAALDHALRGRNPSPGLMHHSDRGSPGGFNRSSQHLKTEVLYGKATGVDGDAYWATGDAVTGQTAGSARCGAGVLGEDRRRAVKRRGCDRVWRVRPGRCALVPRAGRYAVDSSYSWFGQVLVVR